MTLKGSKTEQHLKDAFAGESQANRRYLYFANKADVEGYRTSPRCSARPRKVRPAMRMAIWNISKRCGDPATGLPIGPTKDNLTPPSPARRMNTPTCIPGMAKDARDEGFDEIADWFETLAKAERSHANRYQKALNELV